MAPNKRFLAAWEDGVTLGSAWWVFADEWNKKRFRDRQLDGHGSHLAIQRGLEIDLIARLEDGQLKAYGIEEGSDVGPVLIAGYYFSKTCKIDYQDDTVTGLGKKFYEVRIQRQREPLPEPQPSELEPGLISLIPKNFLGSGNESIWMIDCRARKRRLTGRMI